MERRPHGQRLALERFYKGTTKRHLFENRIQVTFGRRLHACLEGLRRPQTTIECKLSPTRDIRVIGGEMERLDQDLYCFVVGLSEKEDPPCFLKLWTPYKPTRG
jgi:hypothetical protein